MHYLVAETRGPQCPADAELYDHDRCGRRARSLDEPIEFPHARVATDDAQIALAEMARDKLPNGKRADFAVLVEDEGGKEIYRAALSFQTQSEHDIQGKE